MRSFLLGTAAAGIIAIFGAGPAMATMNPGGGLNCHGSAAITGSNGKTYSVDSNDSSVTLPRSGTAVWEGDVSPVTHNHSGEIDVGVGPFTLQAYTWGPSENLGNSRRASGTRQFTVPSWVPPFLIHLSGKHTSANPSGTCSGYIDVTLEGNALGNPVGIGLAVATVALAAGFVLSMRQAI